MLLNDWSSAVDSGSTVLPEGTLLFSSHDVLNASRNEKTYRASPSHDLFSIVRVAFWFLYSAVEIPNDPSVLSDFWKKSLSPPFWNEMEEAAKGQNYERLLLSLKNIWPQ